MKLRMWAIIIYSTIKFLMSVKLNKRWNNGVCELVLWLFCTSLRASLYFLPRQSNEWWLYWLYLDRFHHQSIVPSLMKTEKPTFSFSECNSFKSKIPFREKWIHKSYCEVEGKDFNIVTKVLFISDVVCFTRSFHRTQSIWIPNIIRFECHKIIWPVE